MGRPSIQVTTLHDYTIKELIELESETDSKYTGLVLSIVIMRYRGYSNTQISKVTGVSSVTILTHIKNWNSLGITALNDCRGGNIAPKLTPRVIDDLIYVVLHKTPTDFKFIGHAWTCALLALYVKQNYNIEVSITNIWSILKNNNLSYKRAQVKPTKADKASCSTLLAFVGFG